MLAGDVNHYVGIYEGRYRQLVQRVVTFTVDTCKLEGEPERELVILGVRMTHHYGVAPFESFWLMGFWSHSSDRF